MPARYHYPHGSAARAAARAPRSGPALPGSGLRRAGRVRWPRLGGAARPDAGSRAELAVHVAERGLAFHDDPANRDHRHLRSWLRVTLLPQLVTRLGTNLRADVLRLGRAAAVERRAWDRALELVPELRLQRSAGGFDVARAPLSRYDKALSAALLRAAARRVGLVLGTRRARRLLALAGRPSGRRLSLGAGWVAEVAFDRLRVYRGSSGAATPIVASREKGSALFGGFRVEWAPGPAPARLPRSDWTTWIAGPRWEVRAPRPGDRLVPVGGVGHRPVRRLLMEARVPRSSRASYPVVARGETILWVPGICRSAADLPRPGTRAVRLHVTECDESQADGRA